MESLPLELPSDDARSFTEALRQVVDEIKTIRERMHRHDVGFDESRERTLRNLAELDERLKPIA